MSFHFNWPDFSDQFLAEAASLLTNALNKGAKPAAIADDILVERLEMGHVPPELDVLEIGDLAPDRFRGIFRLTYAGDAQLVLTTKVQANPLSADAAAAAAAASMATASSPATTGASGAPPELPSEPSVPVHGPTLTSALFPATASRGRGILYAAQPLVVPMQLRLHRLRLRAIVVLILSKTKGITMVFKNDPLESVSVSSTFDDVPPIASFLQTQIEETIRALFREDLPAIIHQLSQAFLRGELKSRKQKNDAEESADREKGKVPAPNTLGGASTITRSRGSSKPVRKPRATEKARSRDAPKSGTSVPFLRHSNSSPLRPPASDVGASVQRPRRAGSTASAPVLSAHPRLPSTLSTPGNTGPSKPLKASSLAGVPTSAVQPARTLRAVSMEMDPTDPEGGEYDPTYGFKDAPVSSYPPSKGRRDPFGYLSKIVASRRPMRGIAEAEDLYLDENPALKAARRTQLDRLNEEAEYGGDDETVLEEEDEEDNEVPNATDEIDFYFPATNPPAEEYGASQPSYSDEEVDELDSAYDLASSDEEEPQENSRPEPQELFQQDTSSGSEEDALAAWDDDETDLGNSSRRERTSLWDPFQDTRGQKRLPKPALARATSVPATSDKNGPIPNARTLHANTQTRVSRAPSTSSTTVRTLPETPRGSSRLTGRVGSTQTLSSFTPPPQHGRACVPQAASTLEESPKGARKASLTSRSVRGKARPATMDMPTEPLRTRRKHRKFTLGKT